MSAMTERWIFPRVLVAGLTLTLSACTNPYDPVQRTIGGGLIGAGSGAAIGAAAAGGHGAGLGAAVGGAGGGGPRAFPNPPPPAFYRVHNHPPLRLYQHPQHTRKRGRHYGPPGTPAADPTKGPPGD